MDINQTYAGINITYTDNGHSVIITTVGYPNPFSPIGAPYQASVGVDGFINAVAATPAEAIQILKDYLGIH